MPPTFRPLQQQNKAEKQKQQHFFLQHFPPMLQSETGGKIGQSLRDLTDPAHWRRNFVHTRRV